MTTTTGLSDQKRTYLDLLTILHYVHGALIGIVAVAMLIGLVVAGAFGGFTDLSDGGSDPEGWLVTAMLGFAMALVVAYALINILVGRWLQQRRGWVGIVVISVINALNVPLGTLLGVFTIVVLAADDVRAAFEGGRATAPAPAPPA